MIERLNKLWWTLPWDGQGLFPATGAIAGLRRRATRAFWSRVPRWSLPLMVLASRLAWVIAALRLVQRFARRRGLSKTLTRRLLIHCVASGARPNEALIWQQFFSSAQDHPLPGRAAATLLSRLGSSRERRLLSDKKAAAQLMEGAGLPVPPLLAVLRRGQNIDFESALWTAPAELFVKPRHGSASRGAMAIDVLGGGFYRIDRDEPVGFRDLQARLPTYDDLLVQPRLKAAAEIADLGEGPVLRLTTARMPGGVPFLHSALLSMDVPGEQPRDFIRGQIRTPIDSRGCLHAGVWFLYPEERWSELPWNQARLAGRSLPGFECAVGVAVQAMRLLPGLPLVNWDFIVTTEGPVILEGNTSGDWILTNLSSIVHIDAPPLVPLLDGWARESGF